MKHTDVLILGAGCAGTSLASHLETANFTGSVTLLDKRNDFSQEQRWCAWSEIPDVMKPLVSHEWQKWQVRDENKIVENNSQKVSYKQIYAPDFFSFFHSQWKSSNSKTKLFTGRTVQKVESHQDFVRVSTDNEEWQAKIVFDARHQNSQNFNKHLVRQNSQRNGLQQSFLGWTIEFPADTFDAETAVIMDFRTSQSDNINFVYILPYSKRRALVESTCFTASKVEWLRHEQILRSYLHKNFGDDYEITAEERGELPMTTAPFDFELGENFYAIGVGGGHARPSSGYAFHRIQRHTKQIAHDIVNGKTPSPDFASSKYTFFDAVFLDIMQNKPDLARKCFVQLFEKVEPQILTGFLCDESSWIDDLAIIRALPKTPFASTAAKFALKSYNKSIDVPTNNVIKSPGVVRRSVV
ncbi:MAG: hypothetical protein H7Z37_10460 [Pyrinomonadaceae bacterium]|nr:hypothetical protein [Pyrinomonadaceae bacterium]